MCRRRKIRTETEACLAQTLELASFFWCNFGMYVHDLSHKIWNPPKMDPPELIFQKYMDPWN